MIRNIEAKEVADPKAYSKLLASYRQDENEIIADRGPLGSGFRRDNLMVGLLSNEIHTILPEFGRADVIEIGAGEGWVIDEVAQEFQADRRVKLSMTNLTLLPFHQRFANKGIDVYGGIVVEQLPTSWVGRFHLIGTSLVLAHTNIEQALQNIDEALKPGGVWIGIEDAGVKKYVQEAMDQLNMEDRMWPVGHMRLKGTQVFKYKKL